MSEQPWGFTVERVRDGWVVYLPHQCDRWAIAGEAEGYAPVPLAEALQGLESFLKEGMQARAALVAGKEFEVDQ